MDKRKSAILEILRTDDEVSVKQLAEQFGVSNVTIRSDLAELEQNGLLRRTHGGAVSAKKSYYNMSLHDRMTINRNEKIRIANSCAELIKDGDTLMIDSGTTTRYLAKELSDRKNLTIVTNAIQIAEEFVYSTANVIFLGGNLDSQYQFTYGNETVSQLQNYRADKTILAVDGISIEHGLSTYHYREVDVSRCMIERTNEVIVVADHSKIGKEGFSYIAPLQKTNVLITNHNIDTASELEKYRSKGITVIT